MNQTINDRDEFLELYIVGGVQGESSILRMPGGKWGVVDCYSPSAAEIDTNPTTLILREEGVKSIEFLCLTHPHIDHYKGMAALFEEFAPRMFWYPQLFGEKERLKQLLFTLVGAAKISGDSSRSFAAEELKKLVEIYRKSREVVRKPVTLGTLLYPHPLDSPDQVRIVAAAPSGKCNDAYIKKLDECLDENGNPSRLLAYGAHNLISVALQVQFGETRILLGGDVEHQGWLDAIEQYGIEGLSSHLVKASHHGSHTGYCDELWKVLSVCGQRPRAVITPYVARHLPSIKGLAHISAHSSRVYTTHKAGALWESVGAPFTMKVSPRSRYALHQRFEVRSSSDDFEWGRCWFKFDKNGRCNDFKLLGTAGELTPNL